MISPATSSPQPPTCLVLQGRQAYGSFFAHAQLSIELEVIYCMPLGAASMVSRKDETPFPFQCGSAHWYNVNRGRPIWAARRRR